MISHLLNDQQQSHMLFTYSREKGPTQERKPLGHNAVGHDVFVNDGDQDVSLETEKCACAYDVRS